MPWAWLKTLKALGCSITVRIPKPCLPSMRIFSAVESSPLNPAQARAVVNGEHSLLVLAGAGSGKRRCYRPCRLVAARGKRRRTNFAAGVWSQSGPEMDDRIRERLHTEEITARTFLSLALHIIQQGEQKSPDG